MPHLKLGARRVRFDTPRDRSLAPPGMPHRPVREVAVITRTALLRRRGVEREAEVLRHGLSSIVLTRRTGQGISNSTNWP